jgi:hypothetical protein
MTMTDDSKMPILTSGNQWPLQFPLRLCFFFQSDMRIQGLHQVLVSEYHTFLENQLETVVEVHSSVPQLQEKLNFN